MKTIFINTDKTIKRVKTSKPYYFLGSTITGAKLRDYAKA